MFMEVTEEEAALIAKLARNRNYDLTMLPHAEYPGANKIDWKTYLEGVDKEKTLLHSISGKAINVSYAQSMRHTVGADALTEEAAQWIREWLIKFETLSGHEFFEAWRQVNEILQPYGLQAKCLSTNEGGITLK